MLDVYFVRIGLFGQVGRFQSVDTSVYRRGTRVVCRTSRGLETGEILSPTESSPQQDCDGELLRAMSVEDDLMQSRLERDKAQAIDRCSQILQQQGSSVAILDAEILLDGGGLYFYFLGEQESSLTTVTDLLAETYQAEVQFHKFAETLEHGCGPDCGTEAGGGCGDSCGSCSIASACNVGRLPSE